MRVLTDEQFNVLKEYKEFTESNKKSVVPVETAQMIWNMWQALTGRKQRFNACNACVIAKVKYLNKLLVETKDDPRWNPKPKKEKKKKAETVENEETIETTEVQESI